MDLEGGKLPMGPLYDSRAQREKSNGGAFVVVVVVFIVPKLVPAELQQTLHLFVDCAERASERVSEANLQTSLSGMARWLPVHHPGSDRQVRHRQN